MAVCHPCCGSKLSGMCCPGGRPRLAVLIAILLTLLLVISGLIIAVIHLQKQSAFCKSTTSAPLLQETRKSADEVKFPTGNGSSSTANNSWTPLWTGIRLPHHVIPVNYRLELRIDPDQTTFVGRSEVDVTVKENTKFIVLHATSLLGLDDVNIQQINEVRVQICIIVWVTPITG